MIASCRSTATPLTLRHHHRARRCDAPFLDLENPNFAAQLADYAGQPVNRVLRLMPKAATDRFNRAVERRSCSCLNVAITLDRAAVESAPPAQRASSVLAGVSGGVSGFFGLAALPIELPVTTTLMLRAIADIARHHGEDLSTLEARLACVEVFALGAPGAGRRARCRLLRVAGAARPAGLPMLSSLLVERGAANLSAPVVGGFVAEIATRFSVVVSERSAASAMPVLGALGGATVNVIFMNHFQRVAQRPLRHPAAGARIWAGRRAPALYAATLRARSAQPRQQIGRVRATRRARDNARRGRAARTARKSRSSPKIARCCCDPRLAGLRRMRTIATLLLVADDADVRRHHRWPKSIGRGCPICAPLPRPAWSAPAPTGSRSSRCSAGRFGLPIPHTGIIPNNKDRIGGALGRFMTNNFLTAPVMNERLARVDVVGALALGSPNPANAKRLAQYLAQLLPRIVESLPGPQIGEMLGRLAQQALEAIPAAPAASETARHRLGARRGAGADRAGDRPRPRAIWRATRIISSTRSPSSRRAGSRNGSTG